ncbi:DUF1643 domain-containing protein [Herbaspirillum sp. YR522]|uniref:DUF1643 domain-containing protein n=1 Tax=Herbaspirillum sp. YR522 TaxID=1144342 RepID=UPI00026FA28A|nr:DUF1643 domain-containing protein [Herbaspirillum sp. YR522]EJN06444.1 hypothetical protein PMI40_02230 [Herbaspirillum sp. YR522]
MNAIISACGSYRYSLSREANDAFATRGPALFIMLNPSTADAGLDDPTIRRCRSFAKAWDCDGLVVANLYALRATNPADLWRHPDPVGPENDLHLRALADEHETVVCAWGIHARPERIEALRSIFNGRMHRLMCLGTTKSGAPRHPLYVANGTPLVPWEA